MSKTYLVNGQVYLGRRFRPATVCMEDGKLRVLEAPCPTSDGEVFDAAGLKLVPGFIDTHTHGAVGVDVNGPENVRKSDVLIVIRSSIML